MKSVLMSIAPKWCELIANGEKTIDVRKTKPKIETPFKCYIYCTKEKYKNKYLHTSNKKNRLLFWHNKGDCEIVCQPENTSYIAHSCFGKVIGEFVCDSILSNCEMANAEIAEQQGKVKREDLFKYANGKKLYGWHISDLKIYDEPKELSEFNKPCDFNYDCFLCDRAVYDKKVITDISGKITKVNNKFIACDDVKTRPPHSWCYVESVIG